VESLTETFRKWKPVLSKPTRISYYFIAGTLILTGWLHVTTPLLAALFSYFALRQLCFFRRGRPLAVLLFVILVGAMAYGLGFFINHMVKALPEIADKAIPTVIETARHHQIELPFTDYESLRNNALEEVTSQVRYLSSFARVARGAGTEIVLLIIGMVVAIGIFLDPRMEHLPRDRNADAENLYSACCEQIKRRFTNFYRSFSTVTGAQIIISVINTLFTVTFVMFVHLPYPLLVIGVTFLCGLLPVIGNLVSNTIIVGIGFTISPRMALIALIYLVAIHKLEYFLNSKIVGDRIRNPVWLTLLALVIGERLMGIPGMILAPVIMHYIKTEASAIKAVPAPQPTADEALQEPKEYV
jgi:predicted PurR-regulated permease PerM